MAVVDAKMIHLERDIDKVRTKPNMYIVKFGDAGVYHLAREIIQNAFDEVQDPDATGHKIKLTYDIATDILTCEDDSRGFPEQAYPLEIFCTTLQSGSKFFRESGGKSSGEFGIGMCVVNALSDFFEITSYREDEKTVHYLRFENGEKVKDTIKPTSKSGKQHGTIISFKASEAFMGAGSRLPYKEVIDWLDSLFYLDTATLTECGVKCSIAVYDGMKLVDNIQFKPKPFEKLLDKISDKKECSALISFFGNAVFMENSDTLEFHDGKATVVKKDLQKTVHLDVAVRYGTGDQPLWDTYCNDTNTINNGTHKKVFEEVFCRYIQNAANASMSDAEKKRLKITWDDVRAGLYCVLNLSTNSAVGFVGNQKTEINCPHLTEYIADIVSKGLDETLGSQEGASTLKQYIKIVKLNAKARQEATKTKNATKVNAVDNFKSHQMPNYIPCNNTGKNQFRELFICEGVSAASGVRNACSTDTQAAFLLRGVTFNPFKATLAKTMENREFHDLVTVLKCGIGDKFDLDKLYFNRINIFTDADVDGYYISSGVLAFFYKHLRPIIEAGKLYKVYSPLYQLEDKDDPYAANKAEMVERHHKNIIKAYSVKLESDSKPLSKNELKEFLSDVYEYRTTLIRAAKASGKVNKFLLETIVAHLVLMGFVTWHANEYDKFSGYFEMKDTEKEFSNQKFVTALMSRIQKKYPEIQVTDKGTFYGVVDGIYTQITVSPRLFKKAEGLLPIISEYGYMLTATNRATNKEYELTIAEFMDRCQSLTAKIHARIKGLGELNAEDLRAATMDINNRISVQFTVDDVERELEIFYMTHGGSPEDLQKRKKMMKEYHIRREDLDN